MPNNDGHNAAESIGLKKPCTLAAWEGMFRHGIYDHWFHYGAAEILKQYAANAKILNDAMTERFFADMAEYHADMAAKLEPEDDSW